jgi:tetratricopeptide (TPR) repeat protein
MLEEVTPKICLNMIVKNESKVILRLLNSVLPIIDSYCICDTGSTDNTIEIIETFFKENKIEGRIVNEPFQDFGYNRTFALNSCIGLPNADYLLLLDADMVLRINPELCKKNFRKSLIKDVYFIFQGSDTFFYKNVRILKNNPEYSYWGVTHEYVKTTPESTFQEIDKAILFIDDIGDGGAKQDKFERDIRLLLKGLEELPNNDRYTFYLANSYSSINQNEKAIEYYKKRIELGGWNQEVWFSYYTIGKCYKNMGDMTNAIYYWMEGYQYLPNRIENLYQIINYYRISGKNVLAHSFYEMADYERKKDNSIDHLFLEKDIYEYKLDYEFTIIAYYRNILNKDVIKSCMKVLAHPFSEEQINKNILSNYKFYTKSLKNMETPMIENNLRTLKSIGFNRPQIDKSIYVSSTPSLCIDTTNKNRLIVNVRYVSYRIDDNGGYTYDTNICTKNVVTTIDVTYPKAWTKGLEFELNYNKCYDDLYVGLEDIRLFSNNETVYFNANRGLGYNKMSIETGKIMLGSASTSSHLIYTDDQKDIEKNWVLFKNGKREIKMIYGWYPLKIGDIEDDPEKRIDEKKQLLKKLVITSEEETPNFFRWVRGSTNGVTIDDEVWFICHIVSYEDRRYYYHLFVILDVNTMKLKRYSEMFNFEGEKVEYTLGFAYMEKEKQFLIGYSVMDRESKYMTVSRENVNSLFIRGT